METKKPVHIGITLKKEAWIEPVDIFKKIADAGYEARHDDVRFTLIGTIRQVDGLLLIEIDGMKPDFKPLTLVKGKSKDARLQLKFDDGIAQAQKLIGEKVELIAYWVAPVKKKDLESDATFAPILVSKWEKEVSK